MSTLGADDHQRLISPFFLSALAGLLILSTFAPFSVEAGSSANAMCPQGHYDCDYPQQKNENGAIYTCYRNKPCKDDISGTPMSYVSSQSAAVLLAAGFIVNGHCTAANVCTGDSYTDQSGKTQDIGSQDQTQKTAQEASSQLNQADFDKLNQDTINQIQNGNAPSLSPDQASNLQSAVDEVQAMDPVRSQSLIDSFMQSSDYQLGPGADASQSFQGLDELARQYSGGAVVDPNPGGHFIGYDPLPLILIPDAIAPGLNTGLGYLTAPSGGTVVYNSNIWSPPSGIANYTGGTAGIPSNAIVPTTNYTGFGGTNFVGTFSSVNPQGLQQVTSLPGNTSAVVYGAGAGPQSAADSFFAQTQAQMQADANAAKQGTVAAYLADGGGCNGFGSCIGQGIESIKQNVTDAWDATTQAVRDAFYPSAALDSAPSFGSASIQGDFSLTDIPSATSFYSAGQVDASLPPVFVDSTPVVPLVSDIPTLQDVPPPSIQVVDITAQGVPSDPLSFDSGTVQNAVARGNALGSGGNPNSVSPFIGGASPVSFEIDRSGVPASPNLSSGSQNSPFNYFTQTYTGTAFPNPSANAPTYPGVDYYAAGVQGVPGSSVTPSAPASAPNNGGGNVGLGGPVAAPAAPAQGNASGGGVGSLMQGLTGLLSALKGGGSGSGGSSSATPSLPPVTVAPTTALATPAATTNFATAVPLTPAPQILVVANPNPAARDAQATISWSAQWSQATSSATRECAVIDVHGTKLATESAAESSVQTPALTRAMYFIVGCKEQGGLLGSQVVLVKVQGDDTPPEPLPQGLGTYQSVSGYSDAAAELSAAISGTSAQPTQAANVACDPNLSNYIDCLTGKMLYVDKLY